MSAVVVPKLFWDLRRNFDSLYVSKKIFFSNIDGNKVFLKTGIKNFKNLPTLQKPTGHPSYFPKDHLFREVDTRVPCPRSRSASQAVSCAGADTFQMHPLSEKFSQLFT